MSSIAIIKFLKMFLNSYFMYALSTNSVQTNIKKKERKYIYWTAHTIIVRGSYKTEHTIHNELNIRNSDTQKVQPK
jgi:hypothetical protein